MAIQVVKANVLGFCFGVRRAVELAEKALLENPEKNVYSLGPLIHNQIALKNLCDKGMIIVNEDEIIIPEAEIKAPKEILNCHNDHRIAMSLAIMCSKVGGTLENVQCVNKSYPEFFDNIKTLGIQI